MHEIETAVLGVEADKIKEKMRELEAEEVLDTRFSVDWFGPKGLSHNGDDPWFLRIRTTKDGKSRLTWKGKSDLLGLTRSHREIDFELNDAGSMADFLLEIGMEKYAHQDKDRKSWLYGDYRFDLDQYPGMPAYLEIEGKSEEHIKEAIGILGIEQNKTSNTGERVLIQKEYGLNWFDMRFTGSEN